MKLKKIFCAVCAFCFVFTAGCAENNDDYLRSPSNPNYSASERPESSSHSASSSDGEVPGSSSSAESSENSSSGKEDPDSSSGSSQEEQSSSGSQGQQNPGSSDFDKMTALEFTAGMKVGWNLGNTFDAIDCTWLSDELQYESAWCNAKTEKKHIQALKDAGFNAVRIPVSWHNHLSDANNYIISEKWLDRVKEVIDWCIECDMYVILNIHHDNSEQFMFPNSAKLEQSKRYVTSIWKQLAEKFKDYPHNLLFEALNEPRLIGHRNEWWIDPYNADCIDAISCINKLNQAFVDTVRATGANNSTRYLMCPGYAACSDGALNDGYILPTDPVSSNQNRIIVSVHAYVPYEFALNMYGTERWSKDDANDRKGVTEFMDKLAEKYTSKGIPVVIDEFGALEKNSNAETRAQFAAFYVSEAAKRGIPCYWWDNNAFSGDGERFGLLDRSSNQWKYPDIVKALVENCL